MLRFVALVIGVEISIAVVGCVSGLTQPMLALSGSCSLPSLAVLVFWGYIGIMENQMETTIVYWGYIGIMENQMETTIVYWGYIGIMENQMETTIVYWGYIGTMENQMKTTIVYWGYSGIVGNQIETTIVYWGYIGIMENACIVIRMRTPGWHCYSSGFQTLGF